MTIRAVLWDVDDTIFDYARADHVGMSAHLTAPGRGGRGGTGRHPPRGGGGGGRGPRRRGGGGG
ncbi:hypothetical protein ACFV6U_32965, partial [Streptomyces sp. NPDC059810]